MENIADERNYDYTQAEAKALCDYLANLVEDLRYRLVKPEFKLNED